MTTFKEHSKISWTPNPDDGSYPGHERVTIGCLQRIADATEAMAKNHVKLQADYDYMRQERDNYMQLWQKENRRVNAYKGIVKKLKRKYV